MDGAEPAPKSSETTQVRRAFQTIVAGLVAGFLAIVLSIGFASLLLPDPLREHTPLVVGMTLFSTMVLNAIAALTSPIRGGVSVAQEVPIVVMATMAASIAAAMSGAAANDTVVASIVIACVIATTICGLSFLLLGIFGLGGLIRFVPYPVIGGFLAGTGLLILQGGLTVIMGKPVNLDVIGELLASQNSLKIAVAAALVATFALLGARAGGTVSVPLAILVALGAYNVAVFVIGLPPESLRAEGWLVPVPEIGRLWPPITPSDLASVDWWAIAGSMVALPGLVLISVMALLMNVTGIELDRGDDVDVDAALRSIGLQNMVAGPTAAMPGYPAVSLTLLSDRLGASNRGTPLVVAGLCAAALLFETLVLGLVPTPLLGALLVWIGGSLMVAWLVGTYRRLAFREYAIVVLIFIVIATIGFTWGILAGLVAAVVEFVIQYSRADVVHTRLRGNAYHSNVEASEERHAALIEHGGAIVILRLQGFLFFGTADRLRRRVVDEVEEQAGGADTRFVLVDFYRVTGIDSSAISSFARLTQIAVRSGFMLVISGASAPVRAAIERSLGNRADAVRFEPDVERALFWCENTLLDVVAPSARTTAATTPLATLAGIVGDEETAEKLATYLTRVTFAACDTIIEEGSPSDDMFVIESGSATVTMRGRDGRTAVLASVGPGAIVGEVAFYRGKTRTAGVVADAPTVAWQFTQADLTRLQAHAPGVASGFHRGLARALAERLARTDRLLSFLAD